MAKRSNEAKRGHVVNLQEARHARDERADAIAQAKEADRPRREAHERFQVAAKARGDELPNIHDLAELRFAYRRHGLTSAGFVLDALDSLLHGLEFAHDRSKLLKRLGDFAHRLVSDALPRRRVTPEVEERIAGGEVFTDQEIAKLPLIRRGKGRPMTAVEQMYTALCDPRPAAPRLETHPLDTVIESMLVSVRSEIGGNASVADVRKKLGKQQPNHERLARACFLATDPALADKLGKRKLVAVGRKHRQRRRQK